MLSMSSTHAVHLESPCREVNRGEASASYSLSANEMRALKRSGIFEEAGKNFLKNKPIGMDGITDVNGASRQRRG